MELMPFKKYQLNNKYNNSNNEHKNGQSINAMHITYPFILGTLQVHPKAIILWSGLEWNSSPTKNSHLISKC